mmetsp:Transcript_11140/g.33411  ORF Transcript_11140/g.33411 Transcript_11140/m.33411 type:complete len:413 (+) Transcript_11140:151-1389(+)|eukprot:CAMPEP_0206136604 /NCGR_PEP_ID=MMETSP1473-20131121/1843_1 /ASSEMBLY_ACC=CAM_ASM_001109 /TAXON_ID=1461547 /ORGANISM="Stichococcus sp, Strain RCC1054" /LENGTH=412 /DNA_ID=CAMNT_0053529269 /DNA_START=100 /DNA_END=1338 /DNA_ORIENTATION=+
MSLYNGPARGGNRGGKDQFNWEDVKNAPDREYYLGHSVKASAGRWQKGKDILWYTREKKDDQEQRLRDELQAIKEREEDLMLEAMGMKPKVRAAPKAAPTGQELELLMRKARGEGQADEEGPPEPSADAMPGLGFSKLDDITVNMSVGESHEVMAGIGVPPPMAGESAAIPGSGGEEGRLTKEELAILEEAEKAAAKRAKKAEKKAKKIAKELRKEEKSAARREAKRAKKEGAKAEGAAVPPRPALERQQSPTEVDAHRDHRRSNERERRREHPEDAATGSDGRRMDDVRRLRTVVQRHGRGGGEPLHDHHDMKRRDSQGDDRRRNDHREDRGHADHRGEKRSEHSGDRRPEHEGRQQDGSRSNGRREDGRADLRREERPGSRDDRASRKQDRPSSSELPRSKRRRHDSESP